MEPLRQKNKRPRTRSQARILPRKEQKDSNISTFNTNSSIGEHPSKRKRQAKNLRRLPEVSDKTPRQYKRTREAADLHQLTCSPAKSTRLGRSQQPLTRLSKPQQQNLKQQHPHKTTQ